ncbi:substrate-binding periplasmic protein [Vibrio algarum]|uniref:Transporter substrate-binding domain-containing protein n=1 Tax=Vibrio algarum TaxID=3020714 RepID=A0ABT4YXK4_9VIBR|nr:transporter substrate-binding domain-containing protein [Vibrio sp. KJ40-1]MDB1126107.1 transporter substrate-binding domain-containing protein [Vibrio sp. KJ40-1]
MRINFKLALIILASTLSNISVADTLRVMLHTGSFPPYFFDEGDDRTGTIKDIFKALSQETGDTIEYVRVPFNRALYLFETGEIHIEPMTNPAYRGDSSVPGIYSVPFVVADEVLLFNKEAYKQVNSQEDLFGQTIGVVKGYYYPKYSPYVEDGRIGAYPVKNENKLIQLLVAGRLSQALINKDFALYQIKHQNLQGKIVLSKPYDSLDMMIRFHPTKEEAVSRFNKAIGKLKEEGSIEAIYDKYR